MKYLTFALLIQLITVDVMASQTGLKVCWEPKSSSHPEHATCFFESTRYGTNGSLLIGRTKFNNETKKPQCVFSLNDGVLYESNKFKWLRFNNINPLDAENSMMFDVPVMDFITSIPLCSSSKESKKSQYFVIPDKYKHSRADEDNVCRVRKSDKLLIGIIPTNSDAFADCDTSLGAEHLVKPEPVIVHKLKADWQLYSRHYGWPERVKFNSKGEKVLCKGNFKCTMRHCAEHAQQQAEKNKHRYAAVDGKSWYTGQEVDDEDMDKDNTVYVNHAFIEE